MNKEEVLGALNFGISSKLTDLQRELDEILESMANDTKSTAGDKHETSRAMAQIEQEKLGKQISETMKLKNLLQGINVYKSSEKIGIGSLIETTSGIYFLGIPYGLITISGVPVFCLSPIAPMGQLLLGKKVNDTITLNEKSIEILSID